LNHCRWNLLPPVPDKHPVSRSGFHPIVAQLLYNRGLTEPSQLELFLASDERLSCDPWLLPDMHPAIARIYRALLRGENIAVYGDFDADGITGTALMVQGLSTLGGTVTPYIPHRLTEGYGLNKTALENLQQQGISLIITVDCGITALPEVQRAQKKGLDIIITDHHTPLDTLPPAVAIINPKRAGSTYPFPELTGAGVALKLIQALYQSLGKEELLDQLLDLAAIGTIADIAPMTGENRYLVKGGLKLINTNPRPGIREMMTLAGLNQGDCDSESISWVLAPRLNAAGRIAHAMNSYKLLLTDSPEEAKELSAWLELKNTERQRLTTKAVAKSREQILTRGILPLLIASDAETPLGITGLVAGKLTEEFYRPSIVIKTGEQTSSGSCRSIPEFNIIAALTRFSNLLSRFGGHAQAAGFTLPTKNLVRLEQNLLEMATNQLAGIDLQPRIDIDAEITLPELGGNTFQSIQKLAPFGQGNPFPTFLSRGVAIVDCNSMGANGDHLRMKLRQGKTVWKGIGFRLGNLMAEVSSPLDIVYNLEIERWRGVETLRLNILDFAPSAQAEHHKYFKGI